LQDKELEKELKLFGKPQGTEGSQRLIKFLRENLWSITVAGHTVTGKPSYICTSPIGIDEPAMTITSRDGLVQIDITAPLSHFTREQ